MARKAAEKKSESQKSVKADPGEKIPSSAPANEAIESPATDDRSQDREFYPEGKPENVIEEQVEPEIEPEVDQEPQQEPAPTKEDIDQLLNDVEHAPEEDVHQGKSEPAEDRCEACRPPTALEKLDYLINELHSVHVDLSLKVYDKNSSVPRYLIGLHKTIQQLQKDAFLIKENS